VGLAVHFITQGKAQNCGRIKLIINWIKI
jgi:hypothetical protein